MFIPVHYSVAPSVCTSFQVTNNDFVVLKKKKNHPSLSIFNHSIQQLEKWPQDGSSAADEKHSQLISLHAEAMCEDRGICFLIGW